MSTKEHRAEQASFERRRYPTDLTDEEWERIVPFLPAPTRQGRSSKANLREVLNAIRTMARLGGGGRMLPVHFGPWQTVYWWFGRFVRSLPFHTNHDIALMFDREQAARKASPSAGVLDSQTVKAPHTPSKGGHKAAKRTEGRKRLIAVDTDRRLPRRWVVERIFSWIIRWRRLVYDYKKCLMSSWQHRRPAAPTRYPLMIILKWGLAVILF